MNIGLEKIVNDALKQKFVTERDIYKAVYQAVLGGYHYLKNLTEEKICHEASLSDNKNRLEVLGNFARYHFCKADALKNRASLILSACQAERPSNNTFLDLEAALKTLVNQPIAGLLPFLNDLSAFFEAEALKGFPPISHSEKYKKAYNPHYIVLSLDKAEKLVLELEKLK